MQLPGRIQAAIEVIADIDRHHRAASAALSDWGRSHRFAGSGDRAAIGNLVYDILRKRASFAWAMKDDSPRALALSAIRFEWGHSIDELASLCSGEKFAPEKLTRDESLALARPIFGTAPAWVQGNYPEWLAAEFQNAFGGDVVVEGQALSERAPLDLRVNSIKADRGKVKKALARFKPEEIKQVPLGLRIPAREGAGRTPNVQVEAGYQKGWFEVQDAGSQIAALLACAEPKSQILDLCAGAGGKTLALAAAMENKGQIHCYDTDKHRLSNIWQRLKRAGIRNAQVIDAGDEKALAQIAGAMDRVVVDAPCSGSGAWRRRPDTKWRLTQRELDLRRDAQAGLLKQAADYVKPGGRLVYITCSVLAGENQDQIRDFLAERSDFELIAPGTLWRDVFQEGTVAGRYCEEGVLLSPAQSDTDGFFISALTRIASSTETR